MQAVQAALGVTAGAIRSWRAAGKQDDERVTGAGKGERGLTQGRQPRFCCGSNTSKREPSEERSITHLPRSKGALNPTHPRVPCGQSKRAGTGKLCCPSSGCTGAIGEGDGVSGWHGCPQVLAMLSLARLRTAWVSALGQPGCYDFSGYLSLLQHLGGVLVVSVFLCGSSPFWFFPFTPCSRSQQARRR